MSQPLGRLVDALDNPIVLKEGVSRMRTWRAPVVATLYLSLIGGVGYVVLNLAVAGFRQSNTGVIASQVGGQAFAWMAFFELALVGLFAPGVAAGAISGERERQTLDVLLVSRVSAFGIVWGKLVASLAYVLLLILTALPLFAAVFLFGGIDGWQFALSQVLIIGTALCLGSISLFFSALFRRSLAATVSSYAAAFFVLVGTAVVATLVSLGQYFGATTPGSTPTALIPAVWYFNPFFALLVVMFPVSGAAIGMRAFLQMLFFGPPASGVLPIGGPTVEPWTVVIVLEFVLAAASVVGAVLLLRGRRVFRIRRQPGDEPAPPPPPSIPGEAFT